MSEIGFHIKKEKLKRELSNPQLSKFFGVHVTTLEKWQDGTSRPTPKHYPKIIEFLGYCPLIERADTFPKLLKLTRIHKGYSWEAMAKHFGVNKSCYAEWELGNRMPSKGFIQKVHDFIYDEANS